MRPSEIEGACTVSGAANDATGRPSVYRVTATARQGIPGVDVAGAQGASATGIFRGAMAAKRLGDGPQASETRVEVSIEPPCPDGVSSLDLAAAAATMAALGLVGPGAFGDCLVCGSLDVRGRVVKPPFARGELKGLAEAEDLVPVSSSAAEGGVAVADIEGLARAGAELSAGRLPPERAEGVQAAGKTMATIGVADRALVRERVEALRDRGVVDGSYAPSDLSSLLAAVESELCSDIDFARLVEEHVTRAVDRAVARDAGVPTRLVPGREPAVPVPAHPLRIEGRMLQRARRVAGFRSAADLAQAAGIPSSRYAGYEDGRPIPPQAARAIATALLAASPARGEENRRAYEDVLGALTGGRLGTVRECAALASEALGRRISPAEILDGSACTAVVSELLNEYDRAPYGTGCVDALTAMVEGLGPQEGVWAVEDGGRVAALYEVSLVDDDESPYGASWQYDLAVTDGAGGWERLDGGLLWGYARAEDLAADDAAERGLAGPGPALPVAGAYDLDEAMGMAPGDLVRAAGIRTAPGTAREEDTR